MSAYTPPSISAGAAFDPSDVDTGFTDLATAMNGALTGADNFTTSAVLGAHHVHQYAFRRVWRSSSEGEVFHFPLVMTQANGAAGTGLPFGDANNGGFSNVYDVPFADVRFRLERIADVQISARCHILKGKNSWLGSGSTITLNCLAQLIVDGTTAKTSRVIFQHAFNVDKGFTVHVQTGESNLAAGVHDARLRLQLLLSSDDKGSYSDFSVTQYYGLWSEIVVKANYSD